MKASAIEYFLTDLEARGLIDPDRIAITGMSDGAETLFHMLLHSERRFAAAVTSSPPPDPSAWPLFSADFRLRRRRHGALAPWSEDEPVWAAYWRRLSPIYHTERIRTPILFNLSETETLPAMPLVARLQEMAAAHDLYVYPGAYHNKWRPAQLRAAQMRAMAWLDVWLRDLDTPDPHETGRAARWRAMREAAHSNALP
jgi:dipeptidyl aminopeptidase/acylaminoacyl peptidase